MDEYAPMRCPVCWYDLRGLPARGVWPECGQFYEPEKPTRARPLPLGTRLIDAVTGVVLDLRAIGIALFIIGAAAVVVGIAWYAWRTFMNELGL